MYIVIPISIILIFIFILYKSINTHTNKYKVEEIENLLTSEECDLLISHAKKVGLSDSVIVNNDLQTESHYDKGSRSSKTVWVKDTEHDIALKIAKLSEKLSGLPIINQESLQIAYYDEGGKFNPHYDACNTGTQEYRDKINRNAGQRRVTLLIYLNDNFEGGETVFNKIGLIIKPKKGKGILFWNTSETEEILLNSMHCGKQVTKGEKWICTKWTHVRKYPI